MPHSTHVDASFAFLGPAGYLRQFVVENSLLEASFIPILSDLNFASMRARKVSLSWEHEQVEAFASLETILVSPTILAFPDLHRQFTLHIHATVVGEGAMLKCKSDGKYLVRSSASHRFGNRFSNRANRARVDASFRG